MNLNEREQLDRRVLESADLLADIIGSAMDAIIATDDAQRIVLFNAASLLKHFAPKPLPASLGNGMNYQCQNLGKL